MKEKIDDRRKMKYNVKKIQLFILALIFNSCYLIYSGSITNNPLNEWIIQFGIVSILQLLTNIFILVFMDEKLFSLSTLFLISSYIFHLSYPIVLVMDPNSNLGINVFQIFGKYEVINAYNYALLSQCFVVLGMMMFLVFQKKYIISYNDTIDISNLYLNKIKIVGLIFISIGIIPLLYVDINTIILYVNGSYIDTFNLNVSGFIVQIGLFTYIGIIALLLGFSKEKRKAKIIFIIVLIYQFLFMMTGHRLTAIIVLILISYVYYMLFLKINIRKIVIYGVVGYFVLTFLTFISNIRGSGISNMNIVSESWNTAISNNPLISTLSEFGGTILTLIVSRITFPNIVPIVYGENYYLSFLTILPNFNGILDKIISTIVFTTTYLSQTYRYPYGGSYIAESYYSFGKFGFLFLLVVGILIAFVSFKIRECFDIKKYHTLIYYMILFMSFLMWIRDYFGSQIRGVVWESILLFIIWSMLGNKIAKNQMNKI